LRKKAKVCITEKCDELDTKATKGDPKHAYKKLSYRRDSARCVKRPYKVTQGHPLLRQSTPHYGFLSVLDSNLTSIFNRC